MRRKIAAAALELFECQGYEATTVQQIADRAAVAKGTFFNYFSSKEDLIMELHSAVIMKGLDAIIGKPGPVIPRLRAMLLEFARHFTMNRTVVRAVLQGIFGSDKLRELHRLRCGELERSLAPVFAHAQRKGEIRSDIPAAQIAQTAVQTYFGALMSWALEQGETELSDQLALSFEIYMHGLVQ